jgi:uncharacterized protein YndB with AHSA1/START domain
MTNVVAEAKVLIERALEDVFAFVSNPNNETRWHTQMLEVRLASNSAEGSESPSSWSQGSTWTVAARFMGGRMEGEMEVTAFEPNRRIEFTTTTGLVRPIATCLFEDVDGGTLFTRRTEMPLTGIFRLMKPLMQRYSNRLQRVHVDNLKRILEGSE